MPEEDLKEYWKQMQDDSDMAYLDMFALDLPRPERVTIHYLPRGCPEELRQHQQWAGPS